MDRELIAEFELPSGSGEGGRVSARLYNGISAQNIEDVTQHWATEFAARKKRALELAPDTTWRDEDDHWNWAQKHSRRADQLNAPGFALEVEGHTEGLMYCDLGLGRISRLDPDGRHQLVYVDYLATAPWNRRHPDGGARKVRGVGTTLLFAAVQLSLNEEFTGRIGLHSLKDAESFYLKAGMQDFGSDAAYYDLRYFEMSPEAARAFIAPFEKPEDNSK